MCLIMYTVNEECIHAIKIYIGYNSVAGIQPEAVWSSASKSLFIMDIECIVRKRG